MEAHYYINEMKIELPLALMPCSFIMLRTRSLPTRMAACYQLPAHLGPTVFLFDFGVDLKIFCSILTLASSACSLASPLRSALTGLSPAPLS
jgi:hypothetical protein